jgi:hypothetical protein
MAIARFAFSKFILLALIILLAVCATAQPIQYRGVSDTHAVPLQSDRYIIALLWENA